MSGLVQHVGQTGMCPHAGQINITTTNTRVKVSGQFVALANDNHLISGCPFTLPSGTPHPCVKVVWTVPASRVKVMGKPVVLKTSTGICQAADQAPQGAPNITVTQTRVKGV